MTANTDSITNTGNDSLCRSRNSIIDELPPGRTPIQTVAIPDTKRDDIVERVRNACLNEGKQAYWVCTLDWWIEVLEAQAAADTAEELQRTLPEVKIGLVHGRMKPAEKQAVMQELKRTNCTCWLLQLW